MFLFTSIDSQSSVGIPMMGPSRVPHIQCLLGLCFPACLQMIKYAIIPLPGRVTLTREQLVIGSILGAKVVWTYREIPSFLKGFENMIITDLWDSGVMIEGRENELETLIKKPPLRLDLKIIRPQNKKESNSLIGSALKHGLPVIVCVDWGRVNPLLTDWGKHCIVVIGQRGSDFRIRDPQSHVRVIPERKSYIAGATNYLLLENQFMEWWSNSHVS